jgi:hypothetical protein
MVPASGASAAREVLLEAELLEERPATGPVERPGRLLGVLCVVVALVGIVAWIGTELLV